MRESSGGEEARDSDHRPRMIRHLSPEELRAYEWRVTVALVAVISTFGIVWTLARFFG